MARPGRSHQKRHATENRDGTAAGAAQGSHPQKISQTRTPLTGDDAVTRRRAGTARRYLRRGATSLTARPAVLAGDSPHLAVSGLTPGEAVIVHGVRIIAAVEVAKPGFVNLRLSEAWLARQADVIVAAGESFGRSDRLAGEKVQVEYISANPTGPMTVANARGGQPECLDRPREV